ncbi:MAG: hypothetical protein ABJE95_08875 [Byssovorax sp.]
MTDKKEPIEKAPAPAHPAKKPYDPHVFHPEKFRDHTVISPPGGAGHNHTPGTIPLSPETHDPGE